MTDDLIAKARERARSQHHLRDDRHLLDNLADALERERSEARSAHDRLVGEAAGMCWATDGRLSTGVGHAVEYIKRLTARAEKAERRARDFEDRYETSHASRMHAEESFRRVEAERDALRKEHEFCATQDRLNVALYKDACAELFALQATVARVGALADDHLPIARALHSWHEEDPQTLPCPTCQSMAQDVTPLLRAALHPQEPHAPAQDASSAPDGSEDAESGNGAQEGEERSEPWGLWVKVTGPPEMVEPAPCGDTIGDGHLGACDRPPGHRGQHENDRASWTTTGERP